ncbi:MAG: T9SS type A sorting domain-containing protein [Flavobacteriales bacterium]|nr:T9SS type A sorting domain-containing protein [Flavobacteriales bacterium]
MITFNPNRKQATPRTWWLRMPLLFALAALINSISAQTTLIGPANGGDFDLGPAFIDNNWIVSNSAVNPWVIGSVPTGAPFAGQSAYPSATNSPLNWTYDTGGALTGEVNYFYRDVTVPAGETFILLTFNWQGQGESSWDLVQVFTAPTSLTPVGTNVYPGSGLNNVPAGITGATFVGNTTLGTVGVQTFAATLPPALAGTTFRLIFGWKSDTSLGTQPPHAVDNVSLTSSATPPTYTASALGGLWNSPASWVGGSVPPGGNVVIPAGSTIVVNQSLSLVDLTVQGKMQWITTTTPSATVNTLTCTNLTIDPGGEFRAHGPTGAGTLTTGGATININGDFINNGFASLASGGTVLWFLAPSGTQTLGGSGTWLADTEGRGMIQNLLFATNANCTISTSQDLVTNNLGATAGTLTTNNKLHIDNTARSNGGLINRSISTITVNAHGNGLYNSATPPTIGFTAAPAGGTTATAVPNIDDVTGTLRSITITNPGDGYRTAPTVTITGGTGTGATAVAHLYSSFMFGTICQGQKSGTASTSGTINIPSNQGVYVGVTAGGTGYSSAPNIGVALPTLFLNLMENVGSAGGSGYTSAPTVTFSGGGALTQATGVAVVTSGQVTSVSITGGGTGYTSAPTITLTGGGGTGALCVFDPAHLPTFSANIDATTGMLVSVTTTNPGFGYLAAPTVSLNPAAGAGGATVNATLVSRASLYNLIHNWFAPSPTNVQHTESAFIPTNRRINAHSLTNALGVGMALTNNLTLYASAPMPTFTGPINMGGNTLAFDHPTYAGVTGSATVYVENGSIRYRFLGNTLNVARPFPFNSYDGIGFVNLLWNSGTVSPGTVDVAGSTIISVRATYLGAPTGANAVGARTLRVETFGGLYGNNPSLRLCFNALDAIGGASDQPNLFIGQSSAQSGPWTVRSDASGAGALPASGNRTTATAAPGPIASGDEYFAWYSTLPACTGDPAPGNTLSTTTNACPSVNFTLSLENIVSGAGVTYQWESADDVAFTVNPANLGTLTTQVTNQTTAKYYRCLVTCTNSTETEYSTPILVNMGGPCQCNAYCAVTNFGDGACITGVQINTLASTTGACVPNPGYTLRGETTTLQRGLTYPITVDVNNLVYGGGIVSVWFDWNNNFVFEASEWFQPYTAGTTGSVNVPVPLSATLGTIRMRVRSRGQGNVNGAGDGCLANMGSGTCEDFCITIEDPPPCAGPPAANTALSSSATVCSGANFTLSLQDGYAFSGITYQWQSADDAAFTVNLTNLGTSNTEVTNQTSAKYYRCVIECTNTSDVINSASVLVDMNTSACACTAYNLIGIAGNAADEDITVCTVGSMTNPTVCNTLAPGPGSVASLYSNFTGSVVGPSADQGAVVPFTVGQGTLCGGTWGNGVKIYVDWNQDGDWLDLDEEAYSQPTAASGVNVQTGSFVVPVTAAPGTTRMRVVVIETTFPNATNYAHTGYTWGETEDYCFTVTVPPPCDAPPAANTTLSTAASVCIGVNFTLSLQDIVPGSGITYQWESADDNAFTVNVTSLGTGTSQVTSQSTAKYYRCAITCGNPGGGTTYSTPVLVNMNLFYSCYCQSVPNNTIDEEIYSVTVNGNQVGNIPIGTACTTPAPGAGSILFRYSNWVTGATPHFSVNQGVNAPFIIEENECDGATFFSFGSSIWIDYNQDGDYLDVGEQVFVEPATLVGPRNVVGSFTAPLSSLLGLTGMRVIAAEGVSGAGLVPCLNGYGYGETEDFLVEILPPPSPAQATATINDDCNLDTYTITVNIANFGSGTPGDISYTVNNGTPVVIPAVLGNNTIPTSGSFLQSDVVNITVTNNTISDLLMGNHYGGCPIDVICGNTVTINHCYGNQDPRTFTFIGSNVNETLTLTFVSGTMDPNDVIRAYSGTDNQGPPIPALTGSFANLGVPQVTGTTDFGYNSMFVEIDSDPSNSCQDNQQTTWVFEVECTPGCVDPDGSATYDLCTQLITVNLDFDGDGATAGIRHIIDGGTPVDITGLNAPWVEVLGPFTPGQSVQVFLLHESDGGCNRNLGTYNIVAPTGQPTLVVGASPAVICAGQNSTLSAVASGGPGGIAQYVFQSATGGVLADMTGAAVLLGTGFDDTASPMTALGFSLAYGNTNYTQFSACSNGQLSFAGLNANLGNDLANSTPRPVLTAWWDDLHTGSDGYVQHKLFGSPGSYIRVVEWKVRDYPGAGLPTTMLMQMWIYQSGVIELRYGPASAVSDGGASIGISGVSAGVFQSVTSPANTVSTVTENISNSVWPGNGTIYRWLLPEVTGTTYDWSPATYLSATTGGTVTASAVAGTTTYTVTATVPGGCPESEDVTVTVNPPISSASITPDPANLCSGGGSIVLTATPNDGLGPYTYAWTGPGGPAGNSQTQSVSTTGLWSCLVSDACGGSTTASVTVGTTTQPTVNITDGGTPICVGGSITLTANTVGGTSWLWSGPAPVGGQTTQQVTITGLTVAHNGVYSVVASDGGCNSVPATYTLTVGTLGIATATATPSSVCPGGNSQLLATGTTPALVVTITGGGFTDEVDWTLTNASSVVVGSGVEPGGAGTFPIANPGASPYVLFVETQGTFNDNTITYTVTCGGTTILTGFLGAGLTFTSAPVACSASYTFAWSPATFLSATNIANPVASNVTATTTYTVTATNGQGCESMLDVTLTVDPLAVPQIQSVTATPNPVCEGSNSQLQVNMPGGAGVYCIPALSTGCTFPDIITNVVMAGISRTSLCDNLSGSNGYSLFTTPTGALVAGTSGNAYTVETGGDIEGAAAWIDYNQDGSFSAGEQVFNAFIGTNPATYAGVFSVPANALNGPTRMRVRCTYNTAPAGPCTGGTWGETEDYTVVISGGSSLYTFAWSPATYLSSTTAANPLASAVTATTPYSVTVTDGSGCSSVGNVTVNVLPLPVVTCGGPYGPYCVNDADATLTGSPSGGTWSGTGVTPGGIFDPSVGSQTLTYSYNDGSCTNTCQVSITVFTVDTDGDGLPDCDDECPLIYGEIGDACDAGPLFVLGEIDPSCNCIGVACTTNLAIDFQTDGVTNIQWELRTMGSNILVQSGGGVYPQSPAYVINTCLPDGDFYLRVTSDLGGIVQNGVQGGYILRTLGPNQRVIDNRNNFLSGLTSQIAGGEGFHIPMGIDRLIWTSCDRLDWRTGEYVVANDNPDVTAEWGVGTQTDDGYEMWFYNPNGGYSFRRFHSHAVSDGFAPANATRACHIKINNWPAVNHIPDGVLLNTKVRGRVNGVNAEWGPSCRFKRDEVRAQCPLTKLMDIPGNQYLSCGATRAIGNGQVNMVHARPVTRVNGNAVQSANKYQFRFRIPAENFTLVKTSATGNYWVNTMGLTNCKTYQVDVRASFDNGATWCTDWVLPFLTDPWGDVCLLNTACSGDGGGQNMSTSSDANVGLYPNPNRGDQVRLSIDQVEEGVNTVSVDIIDAFGKRVSARTIAVQDGFVNSIIDLDGSLAAGMYMVNITAGDAFYTERLVIQP